MKLTRKKGLPGGHLGPRTSGEDALQQIRFDLDGAIASHAGDPEVWRTELHTKLRALGLVFTMHARVAEGGNGSLTEILSLRPNHAHAVAIIRREHKSIAAQIRLLERIAGSRSMPAAGEVEFLRDRAGKLLESIRLHQARGVDLLFEAFYRDYGGPG